MPSAAEIDAPRPPRGQAAGVRGPVLRAVALAALVLVIDRVSKHLVRSGIPLDTSRHLLGSTLRLVHYRNTGVAFNFLSQGGALVLVVTILALLALLGYFALRPRRRGLWVPTGLLVGGAVGNLLDRVLDGSVTDFIKLPHWPAFNVADIAITVGVIALLIVLERSPRRGDP